jgi:hypothetical protein
MGACPIEAAAQQAENLFSMTDRTHKITVELQPHELPPARPAWHEALVDALQVLRASGDLTARGAAVLLERMGLIDSKGKAA